MHIAGAGVIEFSEASATIGTRRLDLIPLVRAHADALFPVLCDEALYRYTHQAPPVSLSALRDRFALLETRQSTDGTERWLNWLLRESGEAIGYVQATVIAEEATVAWVIGSAWQRHGYATEAVGAMISWLRSAGTRVIRANIHPEHVASQRVAGKVGLSPTGKTVDGETVWILEAG